ncbi:UDP-N-acetylmuramate dehydrogenase [Pleomorphovibrio marinus]|uniref:UDP-N-acetylmuramate dehydrogenase n=1 Tax=Pleomorphovibrio marinus TaxID=2164132 RepID=UPI000E0B3469|nr:UDP-N-acetylmuramate dehydrogenase [Pleomorphovibrio marinus]
MKIVKNVSLQPHNTFGIARLASNFVAVKEEEELLEALDFAKANKLPIFILGGGSNILITKDIEGLVIKIAIKGINKLEENQDEIFVEVGAGEVWHDFVLYAISQGWGGVENLSLIPGTVGASPMQNIGAYGVELKEVFHQLHAIEIETLERKTFDGKSCQFGYRDSIFKQWAKGRYIITSVTFRLWKNPSFNIEYGAIKKTLEEEGVHQLNLEAISKAVIKIRQSKLPDPREVGNAGSFFKNPVIPNEKFELLKKDYPDIPGFPQSDGIKIPAAWLIEQAGWKGKRFGQVGVHPKQPLVLVNYGNADGSAIETLGREISKDITEKFGINLHPEVNIL